MADRSSASNPTRTSPVRTCVGCRQRAPQSDLVRVVVRQGQVSETSHDEGSIAWLDVDRSFQGRGAYLHLAISCLDLAERRRALPRALRHQGRLDTSGLREQMTEHLRGAQ